MANNSNLSNNKLKHSHMTLNNCILCGKQEELTEEHIFADWIHNLIPGFNNSLRVSLTLPDGFWSNLIPGDKDGVSIKVLCNDCNNKWGSRLQNKTKEVLAPFILGEWLHLDHRDKEQLARWLTCFVMVREYFHPELVTITQEARTNFRKTSIPLKSTIMFMAPFEGYEGHGQVWHRAIAGNMYPVKDRVLDTHFTIITISKIAFFVFGTSHLSYMDYSAIQTSCVVSYLIKSGFIQISPKFYDFPKSRPSAINNSNIREIMETATTILDNPVPYFGLMK